MTKKEKFEILTKKEFAGVKNIDAILFQLLRAREIMLIHEEFELASVKKQLDMCVTISRIAIHTAMDDLYKARNYKRNEKIFEYSLSYENRTTPQ